MKHTINNPIGSSCVHLSTDKAGNTIRIPLLRRQATDPAAASSSDIWTATSSVYPFCSSSKDFSSAVLEDQRYHADYRSLAIDKIEDQVNNFILDGLTSGENRFPDGVLFSVPRYYYMKEVFRQAKPVRVIRKRAFRRVNFCTLWRALFSEIISDVPVTLLQQHLMESCKADDEMLMRNELLRNNLGVVSLAPGQYCLVYPTGPALDQVVVAEFSPAAQPALRSLCDWSTKLSMQEVQTHCYGGSATVSIRGRTKIELYGLDLTMESIRPSQPQSFCFNELITGSALSPYAPGDVLAIDSQGKLVLCSLPGQTTQLDMSNRTSLKPAVTCVYGHHPCCAAVVTESQFAMLDFRIPNAASVTDACSVLGALVSQDDSLSRAALARSPLDDRTYVLASQQSIHLIDLRRPCRPLLSFHHYMDDAPRLIQLHPTPSGGPTGSAPGFLCVLGSYNPWETRYCSLSEAILPTKSRKRAHTSLWSSSELKELAPPTQLLQNTDHPQRLSKVVAVRLRQPLSGLALLPESTRDGTLWCIQQSLLGDLFCQRLACGGCQSTQAETLDTATAEKCFEYVDSAVSLGSGGTQGTERPELNFSSPDSNLCVSSPRVQLVLKAIPGLSIIDGNTHRVCCLCDLSKSYLDTTDSDAHCSLCSNTLQKSNCIRSAAESDSLLTQSQLGCGQIQFSPRLTCPPKTRHTTIIEPLWKAWDRRCPNADLPGTSNKTPVDMKLPSQQGSNTTHVEPGPSSVGKTDSSCARLELKHKGLPPNRTMQGF